MVKNFSLLKTKKPFHYSPQLKSKRCEQITGTLLYYAIALDPIMLVALGDISAKQAKATDKTKSEINWLLDYASTHPDTQITYRASDMILRVHSDASYLSFPALAVV